MNFCPQKTIPENHCQKNTGRQCLFVFAIIILITAAAQIAPFLASSDTAGCSIGKVPAIMHAWYTESDAARAAAFVTPIEPARLAATLTGIAVLACFFCLIARQQQPTQHQNGWQKWGIIAILLFGMAAAVFLSDKPFLSALYRHMLRFEMTDMPAHTLAAIWLARFSIMATLFVGRGIIIYAIIELSPRRWQLAAPWAVFILFEIMPGLLPGTAHDPIEQLTPLTNQAYAAPIQAVLERDGAVMPVKISDAGTRDRSVNACLSGRFHHRYLVLTDTFLENFSPQEAAMAIGHELGHYRHEIFFTTLRETINLAALLLAFGIAGWWLGRRKLPSGFSPLAALTLVLTIERAIALIGLPLTGAIARWDEYLADQHAICLFQDHTAFAGFLAKGARINLEPLRTEGFLARLTADHPDILARWHAAESNRVAASDLRSEHPGY